MVDEHALNDRLDSLGAKLEDTNIKLDRIFHLLEKKLTDIHKAISDQ